MSYQTPLKIADIVEDIESRKYLLPAIQREFVWNTSQIEKLFDSLMRGYPISSFLFWKVKQENINKYDFYELIREFHEEDKKHNAKAEIGRKEEIVAVLDGQQRLTSLYVGLKGSYSQKSKWKRIGSKKSYPKRLLHLNLLRRPTDSDMDYDFCFLTEDEAIAKSNNENYWFLVKDILNFNDLENVTEYLLDHVIRKYDTNLEKHASKALSTLFKIVHVNPTINYYLEDHQELDKVLNIFIRINSGGTKLSYSDLLLSMATAQWQQKDAREEIVGFVDEINKIGPGFNFNKDFVLKSCLVLSNFNNIAFKADNFNKSNMMNIEDNWDQITYSIMTAVRLVSSFGFDKDRLIANYAIIPIAYYLNKIDAKDTYVTSSKNLEDKAKIKKWLMLSLIKGAFGGQPDSVLRPIREIIRESSEGFPLQDIIEHFKGTNKTLLYTHDDIEHLLSYQYGKNSTFTVLCLLYPHFDFKNNTFHIDHIFPKSLFNKSYLKKIGIPDESIEKFQESYNHLGNLQLLEGTENMEKSNIEFEHWLGSTYPNLDNRTDYITTHYIPRDIGLQFSNYLQFLKSRNRLIENKLSEVLMK
ncbi:MAG TPA: DUF262 domain-containing protein [Oligoflexia bacterium]|nr:DUF262 domain-containing protein [Oligoflexia bacterium]